jgi:outer membrane protein TolC
LSFPAFATAPGIAVEPSLKLVAQRPDVRQAEENMHAASAQVGIAVANRLPNFMLSADVGSMALEAGQMFSSGTGFWTLAGSVTQPIFQGGALLHRQRAAQAAFTNAAEQYRGAVITAFQNVADTLNALEQDADALERRRRRQRCRQDHPGSVPATMADPATPVTWRC